MLLRFTRNTAYNGTDYGPDYAEEVTDVERGWALTFLAQGRAEPAKVKPKRVSGSSEYPGKKTDVQVADPAIQHQDPRPPLREQRLGESFPGRSALESVGIESYGDLLTYLDAGMELQEISGVGEVTASEISRELHNAVEEFGIS